MLKIKLKKAANKDVIYTITNLVSQLDWGGSDTQASRTATIAVASNPKDADFPSVSIDSGDILYLYEEGTLLFIGRIVDSETHAKGGTSSFSAQDFANIALRSSVTYRFKNRTPEAITKRVLTDLGIGIGQLAKTGVSIDKWLVENDKGYSVILGAYRKASEKTGKLYRLTMDGTKFSVKEKDEASGVTLTVGDSITDTTLHENAEGVVNRVIITDENGKRIGEVKDENSIRLFGTAQEIYQKEQGVNAKKAAKLLLKEAQKEASVSAVGDSRCVAGKSILIQDKLTGLTGKFWIAEDSHSFSGGVHTMDLRLRFERLMEGDEDGEAKPIATASTVCYYTDASEKFHSSRKCGTGLTHPIQTTVEEATKGGRGKCSRCWQ